MGLHSYLLKERLSIFVWDFCWTKLGSPLNILVIYGFAFEFKSVLWGFTATFMFPCLLLSFMVSFMLPFMSQILVPFMVKFMITSMVSVPNQFMVKVYGIII